MAPPPSPEAITQLKDLIQQASALMDEPQQFSIHYEAWHRGYPEATIERFLKARENNIPKAFKMLMDSLQWRINNDIDNILSRPIGSKESFDMIREAQPLGMTGFCKKGRPVFAIGIGQNNFDKIPVDMYVQSHIQINEYRDHVLLPESTKRMGRFVGTCLKILDMTNLKLSTLSRIKALTIISSIDDLNYPEKTDVYYVVNAPYIFAACWKVVRPLLQERTRHKVQVLQGSGEEELLKVMDPNVLPHFCKYDTRSGKTAVEMGLVDCFSPSHQFHQDVWNYIKQRHYTSKCIGPTPQRSLHVELPAASEGHDGRIHESIRNSSSVLKLSPCDEGCSAHASSPRASILSLEDCCTVPSVTASYFSDD